VAHATLFAGLANAVVYGEIIYPGLLTIASRTEGII
jgi:hypothetical protein